MKAIMRNGNIVTGRLAEIFVSRKVAVWLDEEKVVEVIEAKKEPELKPIIPINAKVSFDKKATVPIKKKAGRPSLKK